MVTSRFLFSSKVYNCAVVLDVLMGRHENGIVTAPSVVEVMVKTA